MVDPSAIGVIAHELAQAIYLISTAEKVSVPDVDRDHVATNAEKCLEDPAVVGDGVASKVSVVSDSEHLGASYRTRYIVFGEDSVRQEEAVKQAVTANIITANCPRVIDASAFGIIASVIGLNNRRTEGAVGIPGKPGPHP